MIEHILRKNKQSWYEFQLEVSNAQSIGDLFINNKDFKLIKGHSDEMINVNMIEAQRMIEEVVTSRFSTMYDCKDVNGNYDPKVKNTPYPAWFKGDPEPTF